MHIDLGVFYTEIVFNVKIFVISIHNDLSLLRTLIVYFIENNKMKKLSLLISVFVLFSACEKNKSYNYHIGIENLTDTQLDFTLYTIASKNLDYYNSTSPFYGTSPKEFSLIPNNSKDLYTTSTEITNPNFLIAEIFDSIKINVDSTLIIKFKPDQVENYRINIFTDNANWSYFEREFENKGNYGTLGISVDIYYNFIITNDGIDKYGTQ